MALTEIKNKASLLLRNRRLLDVIALAVLILIMLAVFLPLFFQDEDVPTRIRPVTCRNCKKRESVSIGDIEKSSCPSCKGEIQYTYKCIECDFEFPLKRLKPNEITGIKDMTNKQYIDYRISESRCPNCGSIYTDPKRQ
ncbi:MAG: hypothetical protein A2020_01180 [Lentisphaerae bacterium GWF2_45_14]|nr:MAG: hypothetical protein A2020_01180 [Lentisphaerae bacterium GWF2_45_14]